MKTNQIKERPIVLSGDILKAILDGKKTIFRQVVKGDVHHFEHGNTIKQSSEKSHIGQAYFFNGEAGRYVGKEQLIKCPFGKVGDRLWVRETWCEVMHVSFFDDSPCTNKYDKVIESAEHWIDENSNEHWNVGGEAIIYKATNDTDFCDCDGVSGEFANKDEVAKWKSPVTMPRSASRILLEVTDIKVERLNDISEVDAVKDEFLASNGNPWVWCIEFNVVQDD